MRPILAFAGAGAALWAGTCELVRLGWAALGRRFDWRERLAALAIGGYLAVYACQHAPQVAHFVIPVAAVAWCVAAWWVVRSAIDEPEPTAEPTAQDWFVVWLLQLIGDQPGIHLRDLYPAMRQLPGQEDRDDTQLRAALRTLGIPVRRSLRTGGIAGRSGLARADVEPLLAPGGESGVESGGEAGQAVDSPPLSTAGEGMESA
ncbi:hypothetical protein [Streptomyces sp. NPDC003480]